MSTTGVRTVENVDLQSPFPEWHSGAHLGILYADETRREGRSVLVVLGPETEATGHLASALESASSVLGRRDGGMLTLLTIVAQRQRLAWVYDYVDGIGATWLVNEEGTEVLPLGTAAEIVAAIAQALFDLGPLGIQHPGPTPEDVLIDRLGKVHVSSFVSPFPPDPALREPHGRTDTSALVYRLGILLSSLVCGSVPVATSDEKAHEAMVRRVLIRAVARPGRAFTDRFRDCLTAMVSWNADERPPLSTLATSLNEIGATTGDPSLAEWSARRVSELQARVADPTRDDPYDPWQQTDRDWIAEDGTPKPISNLQLTVPGDPLPDLGEEDDATAESQGFPQDAPIKPALPRGRGVMPIGVGPPVEAIKEVPKLPSGFLGAQSPTEPRPPNRALPALSERIWIYLAAITAVLLILGLVSMAYLFSP